MRLLLSTADWAKTGAVKTGIVMTGLAMALSLAGCGAVGDPFPPLLDIPKPPTAVEVQQRGNKMLVNWTTPTETTEGVAPRLDHVGPVKVYRVVLGNLRAADDRDFQKPVEVASLPPTQNTFTDPVDPAWINHTVLYAVKYANRRGETAGYSKAHAAAVLTVGPAPVVHEELTEKAIKLSWDAPAGAAYRVYRDGGAAGDALGGSFGDTHFEFDHSYTYVVRALTRSGTFEAEGDDSQPVTVDALDVFPPLAPLGLRALALEDDRGKSVDLSWSPNTESDLAGYNVYRLGKKINDKPLINTVYRDPIPGAAPAYRITAVDTHGNESKPSAETTP